jgi:hypothetical protein
MSLATHGRYEMKWSIPLVALVVALLATACGSGESALIDEGGGTEAELRDAVTRYANAFIEGSYDDAYYLHTSEWQSRCPIEDWREMMRVQKETISDQVVGGGGDMSTARFIITAAEVDGSKGVHQGHVEVAGETYRFGDQDQPGGMYWIWRDGRWQATDDSEKPCEIEPASP